MSSFKKALLLTQMQPLKMQVCLQEMLSQTTKQLCPLPEKIKSLKIMKECWISQWQQQRNKVMLLG